MKVISERVVRTKGDIYAINVQFVLTEIKHCE